MPVHLPNFRLLRALSLAQSGFAILPLFEPTMMGCACRNPNCTHAGKHPRTSHGVHDATKEPEIIADWWERWPEANIGVATGSSSGVFVLDVDGPVGRTTLATLSGNSKPAPSAAKVHTGRGEHYYFRTNGQKVRNTPLGPGLDLRGDGGYVVGVGSRHASGACYRHAHWGRIRPRLLPADPPSWLHALIDPAPTPPPLKPKLRCPGIWPTLKPP